jgi:DEAD/DEAH box helicase domain-containing protein
MKCAAYELPFKEGENFGSFETNEILDYLSEERILYKNGDKWYWMNDAFPAHNISLRSASQENIVIINQSDIANIRVIGEMDRFSALTLLHEEAIYLHQGIQYQVEKLDWEEKKAFVREVAADYYTDAHLAVELKVLEMDKNQTMDMIEIGYGDVSVVAMPTIFKKIKFETHENIGSGPISLPEQELHTSAAWISLDRERSSLSEERLDQGLMGMAHALKHIAPLFVMCDSQDIHVVPQVKAAHNEKPTIFFYDRYPGGIGLSEQIYGGIETVLMETKKMVLNCPCERGCPSCIGTDPTTETAKQDVLKLLYLFQSDPHF